MRLNRKQLALRKFELLLLWLFLCRWRGPSELHRLLYTLSMYASVPHVLPVSPGCPLASVVCDVGLASVSLSSGTTSGSCTIRLHIPRIAPGIRKENENEKGVNNILWFTY